MSSSSLAAQPKERRQKKGFIIQRTVDIYHIYALEFRRRVEKRVGGEGRGSREGRKLCAWVQYTHTFGVCDLTLPARAREPWTFPMIGT